MITSSRIRFTPDETIRIFISSPGDVAEERDKAEVVIRDFNNTEKALMLDVIGEILKQHSKLQP